MRTGKFFVVMRTDLATDPGVMTLTRMLKMERPEVVVGYLHSIWSWFVRTCPDGVVHNVTLDDISSVLNMHGFPQAMEKIGWLKEWKDDYGVPHVMIPNWDRWLGGKELRRHHEADRKREWRDKKVRDNAGTKPGTQSAQQKQKQKQKQKEEDPPISPPRGTEYSEPFLRFWNAYPPKRRQGKSAAWRAWRKHVPASLAETVIAAACEYESSAVGQSEYVPAPTAWLNQHRWDDDRAAWGSGKKPVDWDEILKNSEVR